MAMPQATLTPLTPEEQAAFTAAQIADYAAWLVEQAQAADLDRALARARQEIEPDIDASIAAGDAFWAARDAQGTTVGWLWVRTQTAPAGLPARTAFLDQITVRRHARRRGFGTAMLAALEQTLACDGWQELRLNVWDTNQAGQRLYARAGYECVAVLTRKRQLRKQLAQHLRSKGAGR